MLREQLPKRYGPRLRQELCAHHLPCEGSGRSLLPRGMKGMESRGLQGLGQSVWLCTQDPAWELWDVTPRGHFSLGAPAEEETAALELSPSCLPGAPHPSSHQLVHPGLGSTSLGAGATSHPPGLLNLSEGKPKGFSLNQCWGPQLSSPPRMGAVFPSCDCISLSQGGSKWSDARLRLVSSLL